MIDYICPKCKRKLNKDGASYLCEGGHCYDVAREGYVNLLLVNKKSSLNPGDNKIMVAARADFLNNGYYGFLADKLADMVADYSGGKEITLLDAGCGTGYYLKKILDKNDNVIAAAADISKDAVKIAAKADKRAEYSVASVYDMPFADKSFDVVTCVFSPYAYKEYARVLKDNGVLILVYPGAKHLIEIKRRLYGERAYENEKAPASEYFCAPDITAVEIVFSADEKDLSSLIAMTPYFYKTGASELDALKGIKSMDVTASFEIAAFVKLKTKN